MLSEASVAIKHTSARSTDEDEGRYSFEHFRELEAFCFMGLSNGALRAENAGGHLKITEPPKRNVSSLEAVHQ